MTRSGTRTETSINTSSRSTRNKLLDAAESLFADLGITAASMRAITSRADANLAAANYHFGSKEALVRAVIRRRLAPINRERLQLLDAAERNPPIEIETLVRAFVAPVLRFGGDHPTHGDKADIGGAFVRLCGHAMSSPQTILRRVLLEELSEIIERFSTAFSRVRPELERSELWWRIHFMVGAMAHTMAGRSVLADVSDGACATNDVDLAVDQLVAFVSAGFLAPSARQVGKKT